MNKRVIAIMFGTVVIMGPAMAYALGWLQPTQRISDVINTQAPENTDALTDAVEQLKEAKEDLATFNIVAGVPVLNLYESAGCGVLLKPVVAEMVMDCANKHLNPQSLAYELFIECAMAQLDLETADAAETLIIAEQQLRNKIYAPKALDKIQGSLDNWNNGIILPHSERTMRILTGAQAIESRMPPNTTTGLFIPPDFASRGLDVENRYQHVANDLRAYLTP